MMDYYKQPVMEDVQFFIMIIFCTLVADAIKLYFLYFTFLGKKLLRLSLSKPIQPSLIFSGWLWYCRVLNGAGVGLANKY